ncbi:MAG: dimethylsulfonioproprionate lyase family protein [Parvularcula sp.]|nr:dimethylsulfonioproprionate lyase family protein [Parvularcula sp.]
MIEETVALVCSYRDPAFALFQAHLRDVDPTCLDRLPAPRNLTVAECLSGLVVDDPELSRVLETLKTHRADLAWGQTYNAADFGETFLDSYGWVYLVGPSAPVQSDDALCALMVLGPHTHYPLHRHHAEEIYICVAGDLEIRQDDRPWQECPPGGFSHQTPLQPHALRTGDQPAVIVALWVGDDLAEKSEILERLVEAEQNHNPTEEMT